MGFRCRGANVSGQAMKARPRWTRLDVFCWSTTSARTVTCWGRRLERRGYDVVLRESALGIEDAIAELDIELVAARLVMPERSGLDALQGIRQRYDAEHVPVIVVTALDDGDIVSRRSKAAAND